MGGIKILLADHHARVRSALQLLLAQEPDLSVVGEVIEAAGLLAAVKATCPDLVLLDWELPGLQAAGPALNSGSLVPSAGSGNAPQAPEGQKTPGLLLTLHAAYPELRVIVLSSRPEARRPALAAGVDAFVSKTDSPDQLLAVLRAIGVTRDKPSDDS